MRCAAYGSFRARVAQRATKIDVSKRWMQDIKQIGLTNVVTRGLMRIGKARARCAASPIAFAESSWPVYKNLYSLSVAVSVG
jgi:hypothetical protein